MPTNAERALRGANLIDSYRDEHDQGEDRETALTDLLADLMHAAARGRRDYFGRALVRAQMHFQAEREHRL